MVLWHKSAASPTARKRPMSFLTLAHCLSFPLEFHLGLPGFNSSTCTQPSSGSSCSPHWDVREQRAELPFCGCELGSKQVRGGSPGRAMHVYHCWASSKHRSPSPAKCQPRASGCRKPCPLSRHRDGRQPETEDLSKCPHNSTFLLANFQISVFVKSP